MVLASVDQFAQSPRAVGRAGSSLSASEVHSAGMNAFCTGLLAEALGHVRRRSPDRHHRIVWPASPDELIALQDELAAAAPPSWHPHGAQPSIAACVVCFARGHTGPGARGDRAWAAAAVLHARRVIAQANVEGQAGAGYTPGSSRCGRVRVWRPPFAHSRCDPMCCWSMQPVAITLGTPVWLCSSGRC